MKSLRIQGKFKKRQDQFNENFSKTNKIDLIE